MEKENSRKVVLIGVSLIVLVFAVTIFRPYLSKKKTTPVVSSSQETEKDTSGEISSSDLWKKINNQEKIQIIDIREPELFAASHIIDSRNIPTANLAANTGTLDKNTACVLVDESGDEIMPELVKNLSKGGLGDVKYLSGGMANWRNENRPLINDGDPTSFTDQAKARYITSDDLKKGLEQKPNIVIIDVRKASAFSEGHLKDSTNIFLGDLEAKKKDIPTGKQIILVDNDGLWAFKGAVRLFDMGFLDVLALSDGLDKWKEKGYEIVK